MGWQKIKYKIGFSIPTARRFSSNDANSRSRAFRQSISLQGKSLWSKLTRFWDAGRKSLGFSVSIEIDLVFVWVVDVDLVSVWGIELDLISV